MVAIGVRYLMGWSMATHSADRERPEWPPHPDRVFMALAAAYYETDGSDDERRALQWLELQPAPSMRAGDASERNTLTTYVPVNDSTAPRLRLGRTPSRQQVNAGLQLLPENRSRQPRQFPASIPADPTVYLIWTGDPSPEVRAGLDSLCSKVIRVGHSASLVQAWVEEAPPEPNLIPTDGVALHSMRVFGQGRLEHLEVQYQNGRRPDRARWTAYTRPQPERQPESPHSLFQSRLLTLRRVSGRLMGLESSLALSEKLRNAVVKHCPEPIPEWVSGHTPDGRPSQTPHIAFLPLPFVGREHADGHLLGFALAIPNQVEQADAGRCLNPLLGVSEDGAMRQVRLYEGASFEWTLELEDRDSPPVALRSRTWTRPARRWATVTPIVFDRHPKGRNKNDEGERIVAEACQRIGLPRPVDVVLSQVSLHLGVPHSRQFPAMRRKSDNGRLQHTHALVKFDRPVNGPVILGAGRYRGYGMCRPVQWEEEDEE
ncbi:MAG: type I-U CRISPR-associated protein Cas5/Cas6 [Chloroflexi bacterium]|nr:type I-U CRISPR-associated protein Cas5/Cas6 [Chloroflexota bacterium]